MFSSSSSTLYDLQEYFCPSWPANCTGVDNALSMREGRCQASQTEDNAKEIKESCVDDLDIYRVGSKGSYEAKASNIEQNDEQRMKYISKTNTIPVTVTTIHTKLRHSSPLLFSPEEEEVQLQSTFLQSDSEYDSGAFSASSTPQFDKRQTIPNSPLLAPQLVLVCMLLYFSIVVISIYIVQ